MRNKYQNYLKLYAICSVVVSLPLLFNLIFINNAYENMTYRRLVENQQKLNAIYGSALNGNLFAYKAELFKYKKPAIIVLGSSRVITLREQFFSSSFVNCGLGMSYLNEGILFLEEILKSHHPAMILLGLDFWWFNAAHHQPKRYPGHDQDGTANLFYKIKQPFTWLNQKKISLKQYLDIMIFKKTNNKVTKYENMGISAINNSEGFRKDGSFLNSGTIFGFNKSFEEGNFKQTLDIIHKGGARCEYGDRISPERLQQFHELMEICRKNNIPLILFLPPVAPTVYKKMQTMPKEYAFIEELRNYLQTLPVEFYDFHDISEVSSQECEFFDGFHCGDVLYQKMLLKIVEENPASALKKYLNIPLMAAKIKEFSGHVATKYNKSMYNYDEIDFLHLGCKK